MTDPDVLWTVKVLDDLKEADLQLLVDFFNQKFPGVFYPKCSTNLFRWKLGESNPAGTGFLTVAMYDGKVIGSTSGTRQKIKLGGKTMDAMEIGDTFTDPDFRKQGFCDVVYPGTLSRDDYLNKSVFGRLVTETLDRAQESGVEYVFGTPNLNSRPPYLNKLQFDEIGVNKVKSWSSITPKFFAHTKYKILGFVLASLLNLWQGLGRIIAGRGFSLTEATFESMAFTIDAPDLHNKNLEMKFHSLLMEQNLAFFEHRYFLHPSHSYQYFRVEQHSALIGWIICTRVKRQSGRETLVISDWIVLEDVFWKNLPKCFALLVPKYKDVQIVSLWADNVVASKSKWNRFGFFSRKDVSIISRNLKAKNATSALEFADFRIGWSDNG